ncbi:MAG: HlyD family type I secretion periplasmic adaptor subunit [Vampirovibrio sp.]|nr:HlyD family type I secretion periplasmic adaptor subunit [Vampirovibrio sp.]
MSRASIMFTILFGVAFFAIAGWMMTGTLEESVPGAGEMVPKGKLRMIRAPLNGTVRQVHVRENEIVKAGDILVELDLAPGEIEESRFSDKLQILKSEITALKSASHGEVGTGSSTSTAWMAAAQQAYQSRLESAKLQASRTSHEYQEVLEREARTQELLAQDEEQLVKYRKLYEAGGISKVELSEFEQRVMRLRTDATVLVEEVQARRLAKEQAQQQLAEISAGFQERLLQRMVDLQKDVVDLEHSLDQTALAQEKRVVTSPINGIIHQQSVRGDGDEVMSGENLFSVVPLDEGMVAEVKVSNRDLSYIHIDQAAALSLEAFPVQKFGRLMGKVTAISPSSVKDDSGQSYYLVYIQPDKQVFENDGGKHLLRPGMTVSADLITRQKSILSFLTEPLGFKLDRAFRDPSNR